ncbi:MAG: hypothetical protein K8T25_24350, partial [Planctomycetia bacterium]|nr:hypothetical protein [Planctomycetia bacterium]
MLRIVSASAFAWLMASPSFAQQCCEPGYRLVCKTVFDTQQVTAYRLECETVYEQQKVTSYRPVWETQ